MTPKEQEAFYALREELKAAKKRIKQQEKDLENLAYRCAALNQALKRKETAHDR